MGKYLKLYDVIDFLYRNTKIDDMGNARLFYDLNETRRMLEQMTCDDVVKVTRCGQCHYGERKAHECCNYVVCVADENHSTCSPTWFCPRGKPKDKEENNG